MKYINTIKDKANSEFVRTDPSFDGSVLHFNISTARPSISGVVVPMVKGSVRLAVPTAVDLCDPTACAGQINEAVKIEFNVRQGGANLSTILTEVQRCLAIAISDYQITNGVLPPVSADFSVA